ncbi:MAG: hypothetical protein U1A22_07505 [Xanthomonadaceae bacterium]|nr:hypothetical protein [Xanthomonadaceae bacterium]
MSPSPLDHAALSRHLGESVTLTDDQGNAATLALSTLETSAMHGDQWESFALVLTSEQPISMPQGIYRICHGQLGEHDLFVSPKSYTAFEVVINRRRD